MISRLPTRSRRHGWARQSDPGYRPQRYRRNRKGV